MKRHQNFSRPWHSQGEGEVTGGCGEITDIVINNGSSDKDYSQYMPGTSLCALCESTHLIYTTSSQ